MVVSNASPLITLARIGHLDYLPGLFELVHISREVHDEIVVAGAGRPGAAGVMRADWIRVMPVRDHAAMAGAFERFSLGAGETSAVQLARELGAELLLMDERRGRKMASEAGIAVMGCVGILEELHRRDVWADLRGAYQELLRQNMRIDQRTLQMSLEHFKLVPLEISK